MASIRKRGNTYKIEVFKGRDINGKRITESTTFKPPENCRTEKQIEKALSAFVHEYEKEVASGISRGNAVTLQIYAEKWLSIFGDDIEATTRTRYQNDLKNHIIPRIGHMKLAEIRVSDIKGLQDDMKRTGYKRNGIHHDYSKDTIKTTVRTLSTVLSSAVEDGILLVNPCTVRTKKGKTTAEPEEVKAFSVEEALLFLEVLDMELPVTVEERIHNRNGKPVKVKAHINRYMKLHPRYKALFIVTLFSGCRRGELIALIWENVDFTRNVIRIKQSAAYTPSTGNYIKTPKSNAGFREIILPAAAMDELKALKRQQHQDIMRLGTAWQGSRDIEQNYVFATETGSMMAINTPRRELHRLLTLYNKAYPEKPLPVLSFHQLRHTSASVLIAQGIDPVAAAKRLGHSNATTTLRIYAHSFQERDKAAADALETAFAPRMVKQA